MAETKADTGERIGTEGSDEVAKRRDAAKASEAAATKTKFGTTAGKGLGAAEKSAGGEPKQTPGESPSAYGARLRQWREENDPETKARKKALGGS